MIIAIIVGVRMIGESQAWLNLRFPVFCVRAPASKTCPPDRAFSIGVPVFIFINSGRRYPVGTSPCWSIRTDERELVPTRDSADAFLVSAASSNFLLLDT